MQGVFFGFWFLLFFSFFFCFYNLHSLHHTCRSNWKLSPAKETDDTVRVPNLSRYYERTTQVSEPKSKHQHPACVCQPENWTRSECERGKATDRKWTVCLVYNFQCDLCDAGYVGYTRGHLHNRVKGHKQQSSAIAKHYKNVHGTIPEDLLKGFEVLKKCRNKFDCLVYEMLFIRTLKPNLNVQSDSIRATVFW